MRVKNYFIFSKKGPGVLTDIWVVFSVTLSLRTLPIVTYQKGVAQRLVEIGGRNVDDVAGTRDWEVGRESQGQGSLIFLRILVHPEYSGQILFLLSFCCPSKEPRMQNGYYLGVK